MGRGPWLLQPCLCLSGLSLLFSLGKSAEHIACIGCRQRASSAGSGIPSAAAVLAPAHGPHRPTGPRGCQERGAGRGTGFYCRLLSHMLPPRAANACAWLLSSASASPLVSRAG